MLEGLSFYLPLLQLVSSLPEVEACAVGLYEGSRLVAFVVASTSGDQKAASPVPSVRQRVKHIPASLAEQREDVSSAVTQHQEDIGTADGDYKSLILNQLSSLLPSYSVPDTVVLIPALCLTHHGEC